MFLNTFLRISKKAKIDNFQVLDILYKKLSDKFKNQLVTVKKVENLNNLILLLRNIDANIKKISKQSQLRAKPNASNFSTIKPPFKSYNSAFTKLSIAIRVVVTSPVLSITTRTYPSPMDMSNVIKKRLILQEEKDRCNSLGLYYYSDKSKHIAID